MSTGRYRIYRTGNNVGLEVLLYGRTWSTVAASAMAFTTKELADKYEEKLRKTYGMQLIRSCRACGTVADNVQRKCKYCGKPVQVKA